jgi:hypothetical protein
LEEYVDAIISILESNVQDLELISREQTSTQQGLPAEVVIFTFQGGLIRASRFIYLHESKIVFNATYLAARARYEQLEPLIDYSLGTFQVTDIK